jgi:hypothetical protein
MRVDKNHFLIDYVFHHNHQVVESDEEYVKVKVEDDPETYVFSRSHYDSQLTKSLRKRTS